MYGLDVLVQKVLLMGALVIIGFIMRKCNKLNGSVAKGLGDTVIYIAQPAMIIYSFLEVDFNTRTLITASVVLGFSLIFHLIYFLVAFNLYKNAPEKQKTVLRFATIFTNAGFMGIPLISELISPEAAIYATFYVIGFNVYCWTLGSYLYTKDKAYISIKKLLVNPSIIPTYFGLAFYLIGGLCTMPDFMRPIIDNFLVPVMQNDVLYLAKCSIMPLSMLMIGIRLAESSFKTMFKDKYLPLYIIVRLILIPLGIMAVMKLILTLGIIPSSVIIPAATVIVISSSTPAAAMANIFAERYDGDAIYASKIVSVSTLLSMFTMPLVAALLSIVIK